MSQTGSAALDNVLGLTNQPSTTGSDALDKALGIGAYSLKYTPPQREAQAPAPVAQGAPVASGPPTQNLSGAKDFFVGQGLPEHVAAGIVGNLAQESGGDPSAVNPKSGAYGIFQALGDRKQGLFDYANAKGTAPDDLSTQLEYMMQEMRGKDAGAKQALNQMLNTDTAAEAAQIFANKYERMGKDEANMAKRISVAEQYAQPQQQQPAPQQQQQPPAPPVPQASPIIDPEQNTSRWQDVATSLQKGVVGTGQGLVGAADMLTPGQLGKFIEEHVGSMSNLQKELAAQYSPQQQEANKALAEAHGAKDILGAMYDYPSAAGALIGESVPQLIGGGALGMGARALKAGVGLSAAIGEGVMGGGSAAETSRETAPNRELTDASQLAALGTAATTGLIGGVGGSLVNKLGGVDATRMIANLGNRGAVDAAVKQAAKDPSAFRSIITSVIGEAGEEAGQSASEKIWQNLKDDKPWDEGITDPAITGAVLGAVMGGGVSTGHAAMQGRPTPQVPPPVADPTVAPPPPVDETGIPLSEATVQEFGFKDLAEYEAEKAKDEEEALRQQEIANAQQVTSTGEIVRDGSTQSQESQAAQDITEAGKGVVESRPEVGVVEEIVVPPEAKGKGGRKGKAAAKESAGSEEAVSEAAKEEPYVDAVKVEMYDKALDKVEEVVLGDKKSSAKPLILKLIDQGLLTKEHLVNYENIFKDKDMGLDDIMSEVRTDLEIGREAASTTPVERPTKLLNLEQGKVEEPIEEAVADEDLTQYERDQQQAQGFANKITDRKVETARLEQVEADRLALERQAVRDAIAAKKLAGKPAPRGRKTITPEEVEYGNEIAEQGEQDYFSVAPTSEPTGHTAESLSKTLSPEMQRLVASGKAVIHDTIDTLPEGKHPENVQGLTTPDGVAHFVADKLTPESIQNVALHEVGTHVGMENLVGPEVYKDITHQALNNVGPAFDRARASIPKDTPAHLRHHEALAYLVEHAPNLPVVKKLIAAVRNFARTNLGIKVKLTEADAKHLALKALRKESKTAERTAREGTAYSTKAKPQSAAWEQLVKEAKERVDEEGVAKPLTSSEKVKSWPKQMQDMLTDGFNFLKPSKEKAAELRRQSVNSNDPVTRVLQKLDTISTRLNKKGESIYRIRADLLKDQADQGLNFANNVAKMGAPHLNEVGEAVIEDLIGVDGKAISIDSVLDRVAMLDKEKPGFLQVFSDVLRINIGEHRLRESAISKQLSDKKTEITDQEAVLKTREADQLAAQGKGATTSAIVKAANAVRTAQDKLDGLNRELKILEDSEVRINELNVEIPDLEKKIDALEKKIDAKGKATIKEQASLKSYTKALASNKQELAKLLGPERMVTDADIAWKKKVTKGTGKTVKRVEVTKDKDGKIVTKKVSVEEWENQDLQDVLIDTKRILDSIVDFEHKAGMYTDKQAEDFKEAPYAPLYKSMTDLEEIYGDRNDQGGKPMPMGNVKKIRHSEQTVNMAENLKRRVQRGVITGLINNAKRETVAQVQKINGDAIFYMPKSKADRLTTAQKARSLTLRDDGRDKMYIVKDPHLLETISFTRPLMHPVLGMLTTGTDLIRSSALRTPSFFLRQIPGEIASAVMLSGTKHGNILRPSNLLGVKVVWSMVSNMATSMAGKNSAADVLERHGMIVGIHDFVDKLDHSFEGLEKPKSLLDPTRIPIVGKPLGKIGEGLKKVAGSIDAGVRAHVYEMAMLDAKDLNLTGEAQKSYAVNRARQFINFSASGSNNSVALYRKAYLFSGASLNSLDALIKNATGYGLSEKEAKVAKQMFWSQTIALGTLTMAYTALSLINNPEEYEKFIRDEANINRLLIPRIKTPDGTGFAPTIPFEAGFWGVTMPTLATISLFKALGKEVGLDWTDIMQRGFKQALSTVLPPLPIDMNEKGEIRVHAPSGIAPVVEAISGYSAYRGTNIESSTQLHLPNELRDSKSSPIANFFAAAVNSPSWEGGPKLSPIKADYILRGYFSDWYGLANAVVNSATTEEGLAHRAASAVGVDLPSHPINPKSVVEDWPVLRSIVTNPNKIVEVGKAFDFAEELSSQKAAFKYFKDRGNVEELEDFVDSPYRTQAMGFSDKVSKLRNELSDYKKKEELIAGQKMGVAEKKAAFDNIKKGQQKVVDGILYAKKLFDQRIKDAESKKSNLRK